MKATNTLRRNLVILLVIASMSSCSVFRHTQKNASKSEVKKETDSTSTTSLTEKTHSTLAEIVTERADTSATLPAWSAKGSVKAGTFALKDGGFITFMKDEPDSFTIEMPAKVVPFHYDKRTERNAEINQELTGKTASHVLKKSNAILQTKAVDRTAKLSFKLPWWLSVSILMLTAGGAYYAYRRLSGKSSVI